jgi:hypothetical protein
MSSLFLRRAFVSSFETSDYDWITDIVQHTNDSFEFV